MIYLAAIGLCVLVALMLFHPRTFKSKFPPGPRPLPFFGNTLDLGSKSPWETYAAWSKKYGDLIHLTIFKRHIIIINSYNVAVDLLEKRSNIYSDKPILAALDCMGWGFNLAFIRYHDPRRRLYRKLMHQGLGTPSTVDVQHTLSKGSLELLSQLEREPGRFLEHVVEYSAAMILQRTFGFTDSMRDYQNEICRCALEAITTLSESVFFGAQAIFAFPALARLPSWFPGVGFKKLVPRLRFLTSKIQDEPIQVMKTHMKTGDLSPSWVSTMLGSKSSRGLRALSDTDIQGVTASAWSGGFHTASSTLQSVILAMVLHPEVQARGQEEIDRVVGRHRLPSFEDRRALPYISAICREVIRWRTPTPLTGRATSESDVYMGYEIPKDTVVMVNLWAISRDPDIFQDPQRFMPERFMKDGALCEDSSDFMWGFGRRACAGRVFAESTLWIAVARILAVYSLSKEGHVSENYNESGIFPKPLPFKCSFRFRFPEAGVLISEESCI